MFVEGLNPTRMTRESRQGRWAHLWAQLLPPPPAIQAVNPTSQEKHQSTNIALELQDKSVDVSQTRNISCSPDPHRVADRSVLQTFP